MTYWVQVHQNRYHYSYFYFGIFPFTQKHMHHKADILCSTLGFKNNNFQMTVLVWLLNGLLAHYILIHISHERPRYNFGVRISFLAIFEFARLFLKHVQIWWRTVYSSELILTGHMSGIVNCNRRLVYIFSWPMCSKINDHATLMLNQFTIHLFWFCSIIRLAGFFVFKLALVVPSVLCLSHSILTLWAFHSTL